jgi:biotin transport system substrate-specific component
MPAPPPESLPAIVSAVFMVDGVRLEAEVDSANERRLSTIVQSRPMQNSVDMRGTLLANALAGARMGSAIRFASVVLFTVLTAAAAQVSIALPFTPVPLTLQPMVVLLGGAVLGARLGMSAQILYLLAGIAGLPVFAASPVLPQGVFRLLGPTGGYLMSYPFAAFVAGWLAERGLDRRYLTSIVAMAGGLGLIFTGGVLWLAFFARPAVGFDSALRTGLYPFLLVDLFKLLVAAAVMPGLWRVVGRANGGDGGHGKSSTRRHEDTEPT